MTSVILGARTTEQLADNLKAADLSLEAAEMDTLDTASTPEVGVYPYGPQAIAQRHRKLEGGRRRWDRVISEVVLETGAVGHA